MFEALKFGFSVAVIVVGGGLALGIFLGIVFRVTNFIAGE